MVSAAFPGRPFNLRDNVWHKQTDVANNRSLVGFELWIDKQSYSPTYSGGKAYRWMKLDGRYVHEYYGNGFDFRNGNNFLLASGETWIGHNGDGTKNLLIEAAADFDSLGATSLSVTIGLPTIPRNSSLTFLNPGYENLIIGQPTTLQVNRADGSFTHDLDWYFGNISGRALTATGTGGQWTVPMGFLNQIPNDVTGVGVMKLYTYTAGYGSFIGVVDNLYRVYAASDIVPTSTGASVAEAVTSPNVATIMGTGVYVQNVSKLKGTFTGLSGVYGSTISSVYFTAGGKNTGGVFASDGTTWSGTSADTIGVSGSAVPVVFNVFDSRGRQSTRTVNINVLPYTPPQLNTFTVSRANSAGAVDLNGTYMRVTLNTAVQSLINSTQRNRHTVRIYTRVRGTTTWTLKSTPVNASTTLTYNNSVSFNGPYDVATAYEVKVEVSDQFNMTSQQQTVTVAKVHMHLGTSAGLPVIAIGKYWEQGTLDVAGQIYQNGLMVLDKRTLFRKPTNTSSTWTYEESTGRMLLTPGSKSWSFDGVFTNEYHRYRIDYSWYTGDSNGAFFKFRKAGALYASGSGDYQYHGLFSGDNTPGANITATNFLGWPFIGSAGHHGWIEVSEPMETGGGANQKRFTFRDTNFGPSGNTVGGGALSGADTQPFDGFLIELSNQSLNGIHAQALGWIKVTPIA